MGGVSIIHSALLPLWETRQVKAPFHVDTLFDLLVHQCWIYKNQATALIYTVMILSANYRS